MARANHAITPSEQEPEQLLSMSRSRCMPHSLLRPARTTLLSADALPDGDIAARCAVSKLTVSFWRRRFRQQGLAGPHDELRPGRPRTHDDEVVAAMMHTVLPMGSAMSMA